MLLVEFQVDSPILRDALARVPEMTVTHEQQYQEADAIRYLFWAEGGDFEAFEDALGEDPTVTQPTRLAAAACRRLYRVLFTETGESAATFPAWSDLDLSIQQSWGTAEGWTVRMRMPDRDALSTYREICEDRGLTFSVTSIYEETDVDGAGTAVVTPAQRDALQAALEQGYFDVPRRASLSDVAAELGVSSQAASERVRRGVATLVGATLPPE